MNLPYLLMYTDHYDNAQEVRCSSFEDAERLAQVLADLHRRWTPVMLIDEGAPPMSWLFYLKEKMPCQR